MSFDLPSLPDEWAYTPLDQCCREGSVTYGIVQPGAALTEGKPIIRVNNFRDTRLDLSDVMYVAPEIEAKYSRTRLSGGEVLLTIVGSVGQVAVVPKQFAGFNVARAVAVIHPLQHVAPEWIALCLRSPLSQHLLGSRANTTVQTTINLKDLRALPVPLPPERERSMITEFVGALDDRITLLRETNTTLESIAQALFKSWFVDFDPVRAKLDGRAPEGMDEMIAGWFPETVEPWPRRKVADLAADGSLQIGDGYRAKNSELGLPGVPFVRAGDLDDGRITPTRDHLRLQTESKTPGKSAKAGDTVFTSKGTIGRFAFVDASSDGAVYSPQVCFWRTLNAKTLRPEYLHFWMRSELFERQVNAVRGQAAIMDFVSLTNQRNMWVDLPPAELQTAFSECVRILLDRMAANRETTDTLAALRDTLLPRLISGQLRVPEADAMIEEAA